VRLSSLVEGLTFLLGGLRLMEEPKQCSIFSNSWHFAVYVGRMGVTCPLPAFGGSICPWWYRFNSALSIIFPLSDQIYTGSKKVCPNIFKGLISCMCMREH
jgi:hypothetical protein